MTYDARLLRPPGLPDHSGTNKDFRMDTLHTTDHRLTSRLSRGLDNEFGYDIDLGPWDD